MLDAGQRRHPGLPAGHLKRNLRLDLTEPGQCCLIAQMGNVDEQVIRRVLGGDRDAYSVLMERHFATVFRVTFRITGNREDAEEATQEAFLRAYNKLPGFRKTAGFGTWVYRIAMNCAFNLVERRSREASWNAAPLFAEDGSERFAISPLAGPEKTLLDSEAVHLRERAMDELTPMERTAFVLRHLEELGIAEIAAALDLPANSVKQAVFRAVAKLRRALLTEARTVRPQMKEVS
jgi:RNA polymerase sigma-70 factor (ECF subfamily)